MRHNAEVWGGAPIGAASHTTAGLGGVPPPPIFNEKEMNMEHELKHGQALVITGPQGCGKTTLARKIAEKHGRFIETDAHQLETHRGLNDLLASEPSTVICDGMPESEDTQARLKALITGEAAKVERKHGEAKMVKAPNFIFCTGDTDHLPLAAAARRFHVVRLGTRV